MNTAVRRGRPPDPAVRLRALEAAADLLEEAGWRTFTIDGVARRSRVSKATIYSYWTGRFPLAAEAYGARVTATVRPVATGDLVQDLVDQAVRLNRFYGSRQGAVIGELLGASVSEAGGSALLHCLFFSARREPTVARLRGGIADGLLRDDLDPDLMHDILFGAAVFRLFNGLPPLTDSAAATGAAAILDGFRRDASAVGRHQNAQEQESRSAW